MLPPHRSRAISCLGFPDMSLFSVLGALSKQIFEQMEPVPGVREVPAEALQGAGLAGCSRRWKGSGEHRQWDEGGDVHAALDLKCWQLLSLAWLHRGTRLGRMELSQSGWGLAIVRHLGQGSGHSRAGEVSGLCYRMIGKGRCLLWFGDKGGCRYCGSGLDLESVGSSRAGSLGRGRFGSREILCGTDAP